MLSLGISSAGLPGLGGLTGYWEGLVGAEFCLLRCARVIYFRRLREHVIRGENHRGVPCFGRLLDLGSLFGYLEGLIFFFLIRKFIKLSENPN